MVNFIRNLTLMLLLLLCASSAQAQSTAARRLPINMDADSSEVDLRGVAVFHGLRITQGTLRIAADRAQTRSGTEFADSKWQFSGNVRINVEGSEIRADNAELAFLDHQLVNAKVSGKPATFRDNNSNKGTLTQGWANTFDYDIASAVIRFEDNARIKSADNEVAGKLLLYNVNEQRIVFQGDESSGERVKITIQPPAANGEKKKADDAPKQAEETAESGDQ